MHTDMKKERTSRDIQLQIDALEFKIKTATNKFPIMGKIAKLRKELALRNHFENLAR